MLGGGSIISSAATDFVPFMQDAKIHNEILGSDHCPVELVVDGLL
jgi:exodeoxyribonuclease-3